MNIKELKEYLNTLPEDMKVNTITITEGMDDEDTFTWINDDVEVDEYVLTVDKENNILTIGKYYYEK